MRPLAGYPTSVGSKILSVFPHAGPTSYTQVSAGSAPALSTGGNLVEAREAGLAFFDTVIGGLTDSGTYRVEVVPDDRSGTVGQEPPKASPGTPTARLRWIVVATGAQVAGAVDLDAEIVRLTAIGSY